MKLEELYRAQVYGSMAGLDRVRFRGTWRWLASERGVRSFMSCCHLLLKDFGHWAEGLTKAVRGSCQAQAEALGIACVYLASSRVDKEALARRIAARDGRQNGPICLLSTVEPCWSPTVVPDRQSRHLQLQVRPRKCVWLYQYFDDPQVGFGHVRLQSWLPFNVHICLNGRHWLEKQLQQAGIGYLKDGNCFPYVADLTAAQALLDAQLQTAWPALLDRLLEQACPSLRTLLGAQVVPDYYWSAEESEYARDLLFRSPGQLAKIYPQLIRHALSVADAPTVLRFFGRRNVSASGRMSGRLPVELSSHCRRGAEGLRLKHHLARNSVKMYDKSGSILRIETTINDPRLFKVFRAAHDDPARAPSWQRLRKGVSDLHRRCQISDACNQRYADTLASAQVGDTLKQVVGAACNRVHRHGKHYRPLNPWRDDDFQLLGFLGQGQWAINGFRNRDLREHLFPPAATADAATARRLSARATRLIRLLRAHGLIKKVARENRYYLTTHGHAFATALLTASATDLQTLTQPAA